jgi:hypothetical protein
MSITAFHGRKFPITRSGLAKEPITWHLKSSAFRDQTSEHADSG